MEAQQIKLLEKIGSEDTGLELTEDMYVPAWELSQSLDLTDTVALTTFGTETQHNMAGISEMMLGCLQNRLSDWVLDELDKLVNLPGDNESTNVGQTELERLLTRLSDTAEALTGYQTELLKELAVIDMMTELSSRYLRDLNTYITATEILVRSLGRNRSYISARRTLETRAHELRVTRAVLMGQLPLIAKVRDDSVLLTEKVQTALYSTIPLLRDRVILEMGRPSQVS